MNKDVISAKELSNEVKLAYQRIQKVIINTPCIESTNYEGSLWFKAENFQRTGSFKIRGASNKLISETNSVDSERTRFITASSGNHGLACARVAKELNAKLTVVLPANVAKAKLNHIQKLCNDVVVIEGDAYQAETHAQTLAQREGYQYISPYNDIAVMAGQGTIGLELLEQMSTGIDHLFIAMGGGGMISGTAAIIKSVHPNTKIWGVSATNSAEFDASLKAGRTVSVEHLDTFADGVAGGIDQDTITLPTALELVDETLLCSENEIETAFKELALDEHMIVEGAAALALAGFKQVANKLTQQKSVVVLCGANIDAKKISALLKSQT